VQPQMLPPHDQSIMFEKLHESGGNSTTNLLLDLPQWWAPVNPAAGPPFLASVNITRSSAAVLTRLAESRANVAPPARAARPAEVT
uniref:hypothetical protein n=1 Tax=Paractinoplanes polyasparticus TaxID=2856853 RepID=UPI001C8457DB